MRLAVRRSALPLLLLVVFAAIGPASAQAAGTVGETPTPTAQTNGEVDAIVLSGDIAYIGGEFTSVRPAGATSGGVARAGLAAIDLTTGLVTSWNPGVSGASLRVSALAVSPDGSTIYVGGTFSQLGGAPRANIGAVSSAGAVTSWNPGANGEVRALETTGSMLYAGGNFTTIAGSSRTRLAAFDLPGGGLDPIWVPSARLIVKALAFANDGTGRVLAAGGNETTGELEALDPATGATTAWADQPEAVVDALTVMGSQVFMAVGGDGGQVEGYDEATGKLQWHEVTDGDVQAITSRDGLVYAGGHFTNYCVGGTGTGVPFVCTNPLSRPKLLAFNAADGSIDTWNPATNGVLGVFALTQTPTGIAAGGQFTRWNLATPHPLAQQGFAELGPAPVQPTLFGDDFESGTLASWTVVGDVVDQQALVYDGSWAALATAAGTPALLVGTMPQPLTTATFELHEQVVSHGATNTKLLRALTPAGHVLLAVTIDRANHLRLRDAVTGVTLRSTQTFSLGAWHDLALQATVAGAASTASVTLDGVPVPGLSATWDLGTTPFGRLQVGDDTAGRSSQIAADDVTIG